MRAAVSRLIGGKLEAEHPKAGEDFAMTKAYVLISSKVAYTKEFWRGCEGWKD